MAAETIVAGWSHGARTAKGTIKNLWVVVQQEGSPQPELEPNSKEETYDLKKEITILTVDGAPCAELDMKRYKAGLPSRVQKTTLRWPLGTAIPPEFMNQKDRNMLWNFMAWKNTPKPWIDLNWYWKQDTGEEARRDPDWDPNFPFRLVMGMSENGNDQSEASISDDLEDQEDEKNDTDAAQRGREVICWKDHKAIKETRHKYRQKRKTLKKLGRTSRQALQKYYDEKDQEAAEERGALTEAPRLPGHEWTIRPGPKNGESTTAAASSTSTPLTTMD